MKEINKKKLQNFLIILWFSTEIFQKKKFSFLLYFIKRGKKSFLNLTKMLIKWYLIYGIK